MKKYILLALVPVLFHGALHSSELNQVMQPGLQNIYQLLKQQIHLHDLDSALNGLLDAVKNGTVGKDAAIAKVEELQKALKNYKAKQYPSYFMSFFVSTPNVVKNEIQPALDKVNKALAELKASIANTLYNLAWDPYVNLGAGVLSVAATAAYYNRKNLSNTYGYVKNKINPVSTKDVAGDQYPEEASAGVAGRPQGRVSIFNAVDQYYSDVKAFANESMVSALKKLQNQPNFGYFDGKADVSIRDLKIIIEQYLKYAADEIVEMYKAKNSDKLELYQFDSLINDLNEALVNSCKLYAALGIDFTDSSCVIFDLQYVNQAADAYNNAAKKRPRAGYETSFAEFKGMQGKDLE